ncbi:hypothetical protein AK812_SmicGene3593 [Symbiodinium microadriaticum]|uniref:Uncharacterized protein n=1 Tax=Symbiodinium microadriaticum TaxID=2951 RepID=A0A1Q9EYN2_SYMMI|nr:hypothetical protein AK812_SmicGene3593 [Symbiodinium microadriaticum]
MVSPGFRSPKKQRPTGGSCNYCHEQHLDKPKVAKRPRKQTRDKYKQLVLQFLEEQQDNVEEAQEEMQALAERSPYLRNLIQGLLDSPHEAEQLLGEKAAPVPTTNAAGAFVRTPGPQPALLPPRQPGPLDLGPSNPNEPEDTVTMPAFALQ